MSENSDMTCVELADVAAELALGVLTGRERAMAVAHLDNCDSCREDVRHLMTTGEQLLELLPPAEPSAGFETRVLQRLGMPVPAPAPAPARPRRVTRPGRLRRALAAAAVGLAVIAAGLGGWRIGVSTAPAATGPLTSASLLTATHHSVGNVFLYTGGSPWLFMSVEDAPNGTYHVRLVSTDGRTQWLGTCTVRDGTGSWGTSVDLPIRSVDRVEMFGARLPTIVASLR